MSYIHQLFELHPVLEACKPFVAIFAAVMVCVWIAEKRTAVK